MKIAAHQIDREIEALEQMQRVDSEVMAEELMLHEWGKWQSNHGINLWYPHVSPGFIADTDEWQAKDLMRIIADIPDDVAMQIDAAVSSLPPHQRVAVVFVYRERVPLRRLAEAMKTSRYIAEKALNQGLGMLWGMLKKPVDAETRAR